jgi:hypothetical protein
VLVASGDLREEANRVCWPAQKAMEKELTAAFARAGWTLERGHAASRQRGHGFIASSREGLDVFSHIDPDAPLVVAEAVWQYSSHVLPGLTTHQGPIACSTTICFSERHVCAVCLDCTQPGRVL